MADHVITPGHAQAGFLRALADHLDRWDLALVSISSDRADSWWLHVTNPHSHTDASAGLVGWARSLGAAELDVKLLTAGQVNVGFLATLGDHRVRVWGCVDALREAMGLTERETTIELAELAHFAEHGTVPPRRADR